MSSSKLSSDSNSRGHEAVPCLDPVVDEGVDLLAIESPRRRQQQLEGGADRADVPLAVDLLDDHAVHREVGEGFPGVVDELVDRLRVDAELIEVVVDGGVEVVQRLARVDRAPRRLET